MARNTAHRRPAGLGLLTLMVSAGCFAPTSATLSPPDYHLATRQPAAMPSRQPLSSPAPTTASTPTAGAPRAAKPDNPSNSPPRAAGEQARAEPRSPAPRQWKTIVLHHSATEGATVEAIDAVHRQRTDSQGRPWLGIAYHFVIGNGEGMPDGAVEPTFRWRQQLHGAHAGTREHNDHGIGICLVGNFDQHPPTPRQLEAARTLIARLQAEHDISPSGVLAHGELVATKCPGRYFSPADVLPASPSNDVRSKSHAFVPRRSDRLRLGALQ